MEISIQRTKMTNFVVDTRIQGRLLTILTYCLMVLVDTSILHHDPLPKTVHRVHCTVVKKVIPRRFVRRTALHSGP